MKKIPLPVFGFLILILAACAGVAQQTQLVTDSATEVFAPSTETLQPTPTETNIPSTATESATETATSIPAETSVSEVSFANDIMPMLSNNGCMKCHGIEQVKEGLDLTSYSNLMAGSFNGPVILAGNAGESLLVELVSKGEMPKRGLKLTPEQIQVIISWINAGALNN